MRWLRTVIIFDSGDVVASDAWRSVHDSYVRAIESVQFPPDSGLLTLRRMRRGTDENGRQMRNGVGYLRTQFRDYLVGTEHWDLERDFRPRTDYAPPVLHLYPSMQPYHEPVNGRFGSFDFCTTTDEGHQVAIEWETGNISSSHRSMNKMALALEQGVINIAVLIVPSRDLYAHLTDRIGNVGELAGYLPVWQAVRNRVVSGLFAITVVEHDELTDDADFPYLPSGNDGRSRGNR